MAGRFALPTLAGLFYLEFQAAGFAFNDFSLTHVTATCHFGSSWLKGLGILLN